MKKAPVNRNEAFSYSDAPNGKDTASKKELWGRDGDC